MKDKILIILLCLPFYPITLIGEWYFCKTTLISRKFSFKKETKEYWKEVYEGLTK